MEGCTGQFAGCRSNSNSNNDSDSDRPSPAINRRRHCHLHRRPWAQVSLLRRLFKAALGDEAAKLVDINTIDGFQVGLPFDLFGLFD